VNKGRRTWLEIDLDAIWGNVEAIRANMEPETKLCAIVKGDSYAHGAKVVARMLDDHPGVDMLGVACFDEAVNVRQGGTHKPILILGYTDPCLAEEMEYENISQCCFSLAFAKKLSAEMEGTGRKLKVHMKIDSGMSRLGIVNQKESDFPAAFAEAMEMLKVPNLEFEGIFTHFAKSEEKGSAFTEMQFENFRRMVDAIEATGHKFKYVHCNNSAGGAYHPDKQCTMARSGTTLYGYAPDPARPVPGLRTAMQWKAVIAQLKWLDPGAVISYGCTYEVKERSLIAVVSVGYADGLSRLLSGKISLLVNGKLAPNVGKICMDQLMIDVTGIEGVEEGQTVALFGDDCGVHLDSMEMAKEFGQHPIVMQCNISKRVPRVYFKGGREVAETNYLTK
jgi:alanine racemase